MLYHFKYLAFSCYFQLYSETVHGVYKFFEKLPKNVFFWKSPLVFKTFWNAYCLWPCYQHLNIIFVHQNVNSKLPPDFNINHFKEINHNYSARCQCLGLLRYPNISSPIYGQKSIYFNVCIQAQIELRTNNMKNFC